MDPCPFVRLIIESLAVKLPSAAAKPARGTGIHPSTTPCYAKLKLKKFNFPSQTAILPLCSDSSPPECTSAAAAGFDLDAPAIRHVAGKRVELKLSVFAGRMGRSCGVAAGKLLGKVSVKFDLAAGDGGRAWRRAAVFYNGWLKLGGGGGGENNKAMLHLVVRSEPDPRFVFQFEGEPECSPVVYQIQGNIRQPVFSCKFSAERNQRTRSLPADFTIKNRSWKRTFSGERDKPGNRDRKGWMVIIYDLSGSAVAAASMITPFVPSPGSDRVSRSNPGAWLILQPNGPSLTSWKPWGRLEAWRERGPQDGLGYRFELVSESPGPGLGVPLAEGTMGVKKGGTFRIDNDNGSKRCSEFVMSSSVEGEGKCSSSGPRVQVGVRHVACLADAALFVAVSAAIDLCMDACRLFSQKLRKELCHDE